MLKMKTTYTFEKNIQLVKLFQRNKGLVVDGIAGSQTLTELYRQSTK